MFMYAFTFSSHVWEDTVAPVLAVVGGLRVVTVRGSNVILVLASATATTVTRT